MKQLHFILFACVIMVALHAKTYAQADSSLLQMKPLVGKWSGSGWMMTPQRERVEFNQTEDISMQLDGRLLVVNGMGKDKVSNEKIFEAFGILSFSNEQKKYVFSAYTHEGQHTLADVAIDDGKFDWWFKAPNGGTVKYSITFTDTTWSEDGHFSPDGESWYPFFHMDLTKD